MNLIKLFFICILGVAYSTHFQIPLLSSDEEELYSEMMSFTLSPQMDRVFDPMIRSKSQFQSQLEILSRIDENLKEVETTMENMSTLEKHLQDHNHDIMHGTNATSHSDKDTPLSVASLNARFIQHSKEMLLQILQRALEERQSEIQQHQSMKNSTYVWNETDEESVLSILYDLSHLIESLINESMAMAVKRHIHQEVIDHIHPLQSHATQVMKDEAVSSPTAFNLNNQCMGVNEVACAIKHYLHQEKYYNQKYDYLQGSSIVYGSSWTSDTLTTSMNEWSYKLLNITKSIPELLEKIIPSEWNWHWDLPTEISMIPSQLLHSLNPFFTTLNTIMVVPSPETPTSSNLSFRSCWPFEGTKGKISFRLQHPIILEEFSVDHYPTQFDTSEYLLRDRLSAPRVISVIGYPPCDRPYCKSLGFDTESAVNLGTYEYKLVPPSRLDKEIYENIPLPYRSGQTFQILSNDWNSKNMTNIIAVTFYIESNWGHDNFTCVYRIRLHGKIQ